PGLAASTPGRGSRRESPDGRVAGSSRRDGEHAPRPARGAISGTTAERRTAVTAAEAAPEAGADEPGVSLVDSLRVDRADRRSRRPEGTQGVSTPHLTEPD